MDHESEQKADCYSAGDRGLMVWSQGLRRQLLGPLLFLLTRVGVSANGLTLLALAAGLGFCAAFGWSRPVALMLLAFHVVLDALDGPLARYRGTASRRGSLTDTLSDQTVVAASSLTLIFHGVIHPLPGGLYIFLYTVVIAFAMVRNALAIPYSWLVRPRFLVYVWLVVELSVWPGSLNYVLWGFCVLLLGKMVSGFIHLHRRL
jgi:phosphatidylglycerophosphate synthase